MRHFELFQNKSVHLIWLVCVLSACSVLNNRNHANNYCSALKYFLEQDARLEYLEKGDSNRVSFYSNHYESLVDCLDRDTGVLFVPYKSQLPNYGVNSYQLMMSTLNVTSDGDGVLLTFLHLGEGVSYEVIVQMEERGPYILNVIEFQSDKSQLE